MSNQTDRGRDVLATAIEGMTAALADQVQETHIGNEVAQALVEVTTERTEQLHAFTLQQADREQRTNRRAMLRDGLIAAALVVLLINAFQGAQTRGQLVSCTTPGGSCYERNAERSEPVVAGIIERLDRIEAKVDAR